MSQAASPTADTKRQGLVAQVKGLDNRFWIVNVMEMFERLAYYGVRSVVAIYMVLPVELGGPEFDHVQKGFIFAWWAAVQSFLPMFTGGFADRYGHKKTIAVAIIVKVLGYGMMAHFMSFWGFFFGALFLAAGTAIFKPGVQGTLAATLKDSNASVGWAVFYQLVNVGGFLGPVLAGVLRLWDWTYVFWSCAIIVSINFLWLPFYKDPTQEGDYAVAGHQRRAWSALSQFLSPRTARVTTAIWALLLVGLLAAVLTGALDSWGYVYGAAFFTAVFAYYLPNKASFDAGRDDALSVLIVSVVGLFRPRVFFFCLVFSGFWLMFNQVFDLLPNVIDDWVDSSGLIGFLGEAFATPAVPTVLAGFLGAVFGGICALGVLLAMRPDHREAKDVPIPAYAVVAIAFTGALWFPFQHFAPSVALWIVPVLAVAGAATTYLSRVGAVPIAWGTALVGTAGSFWAMRETFLGAASTLTQMAAEGAQVNPEWMINLNPGLIVFTVVFFGYLSSFVRPLTSIIIGMIVATVGSVIAGTAVLGWVCVGGILVFSIGEMLSSPKKMEYLATLAPRGSEGLFMGYVNVPVAIGWITGSIFAGARYEQGGDKVNLAKQYLVDKLDVSGDVVASLDKSQVVPFLAERLDLSLIETQRLLFETYQPWTLWYDIGLIGFASIIGMIIYDRVLRYVDGKAAKAAAGAAEQA